MERRPDLGNQTFRIKNYAQMETPRNERWPTSEVTRRLQDRPWIPVSVRLEWSTGVEIHEADATRWEPNRPWVYVVLNDPRLQTWGVWLDVKDVRRR